MTRAPPVLGEHTFEVLGELGYEEADFTKFKAEGIV